MGSSDLLKREAYEISKFLKLLLMSGLKLPYALALQLIKMPFGLILQDCRAVLGLLFSDGRYASFTMQDSVVSLRKTKQNNLLLLLPSHP